MDNLSAVRLDNGVSCQHTSHATHAQVRLSVEPRARIHELEAAAVATPFRGPNPGALGHGQARVRH
jgi:hypothetical protein